MPDTPDKSTYASPDKSVSSNNVEIERKFLVVGDGWKSQAKAKPIRQGYLATGKGLTVRARQKGDKAFLTIKAARDATSRYEFEYSIPVSDALQMLETICPHPPIEKIRYIVEEDGNTWEIDVFEGANQGLIVAEIELKSADQAFNKPGWLGPEVSDDIRFFNASIAYAPFNTWNISYPDLIREKQASAR